MAKITYVEPGGVERVVEGHVGESAMEAAVRIGVEGIDADCGGACACACRLRCNGWRFRGALRGDETISVDETVVVDVNKQQAVPNH